MKKLTLILSMMLALIGINANAAMYIVGTSPFGGWDPAVGEEMTLLADGTYTLDATLTTDATIYFIFTEAIGDWTAVNGNRWDPGTGDDLTVQPEVEFTPVKDNTNKSFKFTGTIGEKYTFTFNPSTKKAMVSGYVEPITEFIYTVLGNSADVFGETWNTGLTENVMTLDETDGLYKLVKNGVEIAGGFTLEYKVHDNLGIWYPGGDNQTYYFEESGTYDLTFTFNAGTSEVGLTVTKVSDGPEVNPLTGELYMLGQVNGNNWAGNVGATMATADGNIFTLTDAVIGDSGDGFGYFSFTSKLGTATDDWGFAAYRRGAMTDGELVSNGVLAELADWGTTYAFKASPGYYDVTVNLNDGTVLLTAKEAPEPEIDDVFIIGDVNNIGWSATQGVQMNYDETNKVYTAEITTQEQGDLGVAYFGFTKKLADPESESEDIWQDIAAFRFGPESNGAFEMTEELLDVACTLATDGSYESIAIPAGTWTVTVDLVGNTFKINGTWPVDTVIPEPEVADVYIIGDVNNIGWSATQGVQMNYDETNKVYTAEITTQNQGDLGIAYFGFTKKLADPESETAWDDIAPYRFGPESNGAFEMTEELLDAACTLATDGSYESIAIPAGTWTVTVDLVGNTFKINGEWPVDTVIPEPEVDDVYIIGDVNNIGWSATQGVQMNYDETNKIYTAEITTQEQGDLGVAYFGFTKKLADPESESEDIWQDIAAYRFGPVSEGPFEMTEELLDVACTLATDGSYESIAIPAGTWTVTVDLVTNTFKINGEWPIDTVIPEPYTGDLYILGEANGNGWDPSVGVKMDYNAEQAVFTAEIDAMATNYDEALEANYSYFSFTKVLAENEGDWAAIAGQRIGAVSNGDFLVTDELLGQELSITNGENAFKVPSGYTYDITVSVDNMKAIINRVAWELGDVNHDHALDVSDVTALIAYILGNTPEKFFITEANVDGDDAAAYDVGDVTALIAKILNN